MSVVIEINDAIDDVIRFRSYGKSASEFYKNVSDRLFDVFEYSVLPIGESIANSQSTAILGEYASPLSNQKSSGSDHGTDDWWDL